MSSKLVADMNFTGYQYESGTYASPSGALQPPGQVQNFDGGDDPGMLTWRTQGDDSRSVAGNVVGTERYTPSMSYHPQDWRSLLFVLGSGATTGAGPYTHTIVMANGNDGNPYTSGAEIPWISRTLYNARVGKGTGNNSIRTYKGAVTDELAIDIPAGGLITVDESFVAQSRDYSSGAAATKPTLLTGRPWISSDFLLHIPSGTPMNKNTNISIRMANGFSADPVNNNTTVVDVPTPGDREFEITLDGPAYSDWAAFFADRGVDATNFNAMIYGTKSGSESVRITFSGCWVPSTEFGAGLTGNNEDSFTFMAREADAVVVDDISVWGAF